MRFLVSALLAASALAGRTCFNGVLPSGEQAAFLTNVVSAAILGTEAARNMSEIDIDTTSLFPLGFDWLNSSTTVTGLMYDSLNKDFFNGVRLNSSYAGAPYFTYSPVIGGDCANLTRNYDYTGSFQNYMSTGNTACAYPDLTLVDHLVSFIGTVEGCSDFLEIGSESHLQATASQYDGYFVRGYAVEGKFVNNNDIYGQLWYLPCVS